MMEAQDKQEGVTASGVLDVNEQGKLTRLTA
jgi:hypothetical protein